MSKKQCPVCKQCGSGDVQADAWATWNMESQSWEVSFTSDDKGAYCNRCDGETRLTWIVVTEFKPCDSCDTPTPVQLLNRGECENCQDA